MIFGRDDCKAVYLESIGFVVIESETEKHSQH